MISEFAQCISTICCTFDLWTAHTQYGYFCVTAHYIDQQWILQNKIIAFKQVEYPNIRLDIFKCIMNVLCEYNIQHKILSISFDNNFK